MELQVSYSICTKISQEIILLQSKRRAISKIKGGKGRVA